MPFHNSYHFVPTSRGDHKDDLEVEAFRAGNSNEVVHDRYVEQTHCGRIVCRLTAESPFVVGAARRPIEPAEVEPFEFEPGKPAIPGSSLRGLISSVVEAASNSALRVLEDRIYSFRRRADQGEALSAIGMVFEKTDDSGEKSFWLQPLTWPTIGAGGDGRRPGAPTEYELPSDFDGMYEIANLRVHIGNQETIRDRRFRFETWTRKQPVYYGMKLSRRIWTPGSALPSDDYLHRKKNYLLGQRTNSTAPADQLPRKWSEIPSGDRGDYTRGIMRVLGCAGREAMPGTKHHELFIPYPEGAEQWPQFPLGKNVIERFHQLADERTESQGNDTPEILLLPFHPVGTARNNSPEDGRKFRLKDGDLVYFRAHRGQVAEISLSSIWRGRVEAKDGAGGEQTAYDFFRHVDSELLPFSSSRTVITAAERLFGFVEQRKKGGTVGEKQALALSGRVRFSDGLLERWRGKALEAGQSYYEAPVVLRILGSPKPPCPALYFKNGRDTNSYISKSQLDASRHFPQGRKFYVHNHARPNNMPFWETQKPTDGLKQKACVRPVASSTEFWFHVDFYNLTDTELALLKYALRPGKDFRHKLGMGKSIGLGQVRIDPMGVFWVERQARYSPKGLQAKRYTSCWVEQSVNLQDWPARYEFEKQAETGSQVIKEFAPKPDIARALELLGKSTTPQPVHCPTMDSDPYSEGEAFEWFVENEKLAAAALQPIHERTPSLPTLPNDPGEKAAPQRGRRR